MDEANSLGKLFDPESVAVFGASDSADSVGGQVFRKLLKSAIADHVVPVNPKHARVSGRPCVPDLRLMRGQIDLAVIATPAAAVPAILAHCGEVGIRFAIILSAGFGEAGGDTALAEGICSVAEANGIRFLGPNCVGLVRPWRDFDATFLRSETPKGGLALVSQSGALCSAISDWAGPNNLGFSAMVSMGNALNVGFGDVVRFLADDPQTSAIMLYVEGVRRGSEFVAAVRDATTRKPVVVLKGGRHAGGSQAAVTHTGALVGEDAVFEAVLNQSGAVRAQTFGQLFAAAEMLSGGARAAGPRLGIVTNGGGAGVLATDRAAEMGVCTPPPSATALASLDRVLSPHWSRANPMDILGDADPGAFRAAICTALDDAGFDGVLVMLTPQAMTDALAVADALAEEVAQRAGGKPVLACFMGETSVEAARHRLSQAGIAEFTTPERAVEAFSFLAQHQHNLELADAAAPTCEIQGVDTSAVSAVVLKVQAEGRRVLTATEAKAVLAAYDIPTDRAIDAVDEADAVAAAATVGYPVALKILSPDITHKSDVGGVVLNIADEAQVRTAFQAMLNRVSAVRPQATLTGVTVEPMARVRDARELLVGLKHDLVFGPVIAFGSGGVAVEIHKDRALALPPLTPSIAARTIARTRVDGMLDRFRDLDPVDRAAVVDVMLRVSRLVEDHPTIRELDINPLLAGPDGVLALDARIEIFEGQNG